MTRRIDTRYGVEVYNNPSGDIVIKQDSAMYGEDDVFVVISPEDVPTISRWLAECAEDGLEIRRGLEKEEDDEPADVRNTDGTPLKLEQ